MSISDSVSRVTDYFKRNGLRPTLRRLGLAAKRSLFSSRMVLFCYDLSAQSRPTSDLPDSPEVERKKNETEISPQDLQELISFWNPKLARRRIKERFELGASLWLIKADGRLAGYGWSLRGHTVEPHYFPLEPDDVHLFDFYVFPQYRGHGVNPLLVSYILHSLAVEGLGRAFIEAAEWNRAQLASLRRTPFRCFGSARKCTLFQHTIVCWEENKTVKQKQNDEKNASFAAPDQKRAPIQDLQA